MTVCSYWKILRFDTIPRHWRVESGPSFRFISMWMFLLNGEASMGLTKASSLHTNTHEYVRLASFWGDWTLNKATSWPPWKPRSSTEKHKEETGSPIQTHWEPWAHERGLPYSQRKPNLQLRPWDAFDQTAWCHSARPSQLCPYELSETVRGWEAIWFVFWCLIATCDCLASTQLIQIPVCGHTLRGKRQQMEKITRTLGQVLLCDQNVTWNFVILLRFKSTSCFVFSSGPSIWSCCSGIWKETPPWKMNKSSSSEFILAILSAFS